VLAGGRSRRFGSDKALAEFGGQPLIEYAIAALAAQTDRVVICGRSWPGHDGLADVPPGGEGPLAGLAAALLAAQGQGYRAVLTAPCDVTGLPPDLAARLSPGPAFAAGQPTVGLWPAALAPLLVAHFGETSDRSLMGWARRAGAVAVECGPIANINTPADLLALRD
jgi:molybdopterin-guanine dinucleotide biosynthesis protein A